MKPIVRSFMQSFVGEDAWNAMAKQPASFTRNEQLETVFLFGIGFHHALSGFCIVLGAVRGDFNLVRHGMLAEAAFELKDFIFLVTASGPYAGDALKKELKRVLIFHHLPAILSAPLLVYSGMHSNVHAQIVAASLILDGLIGVWTDALGIVLKAKGALLIVVIMDILSTFAVFALVRFVIFPSEAYKLIMDLYVLDHHASAGILSVASLMLTAFNFVVMAIKSHKAIKAVKNYQSPEIQKKKNA